MGLFDGFVDPQQFNSVGGLLGRLLALPQMHGVYQPDDDVDATSVALTPSVSPMLAPAPGPLGASGLSLSPATPYQAVQQSSGSQSPAMSAASSPIGPASASQSPTGHPNSALAGGAYDRVNLASSQAWRTVLAQYSPAITPVGIPLPPVFIPGTSENNAFVHSTISAGRAIGNASGNILNSDNNENPVPGTTPGDKTKGRSRIFVKPGGYDDAVKDFNGLNPTNVRPIPEGGLAGTLSDGRDVNVRPGSSDGRPSRFEMARNR